MVRILGLDYGEKRIGLAVNSAGLALPYQVIANDDQLWLRLAEVIREENVEQLVVGWPLNLQGQETAKTKEVAGFIAVLKTKIKLPVHQVDERLTTRMLAKDLKAKDKHSAAEILQTYLDQKNLR